MLRYWPGAQLRRLDLVGWSKQLGGLAEVQPGLERGEVGVAHLGRDENFCSIHSIVGSTGRVYIHEMRPRAKKFFERSASRGFTPSSLHASSVIVVIGTWITRYDGERAVVERVGVVADLVEVALVERVGVDEHRRARRQLGQVGLQRRRVHRHEHVRRVARRDDVVVGDVHLERRHAGDGAGRRTDLGREVRHRRQVVAEHGADVGEAVAGELHAVAGVAGEPDDDLVEVVGLERSGLGCRGHASLTSLCGLMCGPDCVARSILPTGRRAPGDGARRVACRSRRRRPSVIRVPRARRRPCGSAASMRRRSRARPIELGLDVDPGARRRRGAGRSAGAAGRRRRPRRRPRASRPRRAGPRR